MKRLIVSGCSFTNYFPPTWPVFLSRSFDQTYNYGLTGSGNEYIFHSILDADSELVLTPEDTVIIVWSGHYRLDQFHICEPVVWNGKGDISYRDDYRVLMEMYTDRALLKRSINFILATRRLLVARGVNFLFSSIYDLRDSPLQDNLSEIYESRFAYPNGLTNLYSDYPELHEEGWLHPGPSAHHLFAGLLAKAAGIPFHEDDDVGVYVRHMGTEDNIYKKNRAIVAHPQYNDAFRPSSNTTESVKPTLYCPETLDIYKKILMDVFPVNTT